MGMSKVEFDMAAKEFVEKIYAQQNVHMEKAIADLVKLSSYSSVSEEERLATLLTYTAQQASLQTIMSLLPLIWKLDPNQEPDRRNILKLVDTKSVKGTDA